jgi:hypothetical protein
LLVLVLLRHRERCVKQRECEAGTKAVAIGLLHLLDPLAVKFQENEIGSQHLAKGVRRDVLGVNYPSRGLRYCNGT